MKQNISIEQLNILDFKQQKNIATLFGQYGNCVRNDKDGNEYFNLGILAERINIGRMMELLEESCTVFNIMRYDDCNGKLWNIRGTLHRRENRFLETLEPELCDALWEAIKHLL